MKKIVAAVLWGKKKKTQGFSQKMLFDLDNQRHSTTHYLRCIPQALLKMKLMEEAEELADSHSKENCAFEAADLIYFALTRYVVFDDGGWEVQKKRGNSKKADTISLRFWYTFFFDHTKTFCRNLPELVWLKGGVRKSAIKCDFLLFWGRQPHHECKLNTSWGDLL